MTRTFNLLFIYSLGTVINIKQKFSYLSEYMKYTVPAAEITNCDTNTETISVVTEASNNLMTYISNIHWPFYPNVIRPAYKIILKLNDTMMYITTNSLECYNTLVDTLISVRNINNDIKAKAGEIICKGKNFELSMNNSETSQAFQRNLMNNSDYDHITENVNTIKTNTIELHGNLITFKNKLESMINTGDVFVNLKSRFIEASPIDTFNQLLLDLSFDQLMIAVNLVGLVVLILVLIRIGFTCYIGYLIKYYNLIQKYPKIAKWIEFRNKLQQYYVIYYLILLFIIILAIIVFNVCMLFQLI